METSVTLRLIGFIAIIFGVVMAWNPELMSNKPIPTDTFRAIERRIWWGVFIGIGTLFMFHHQISPWQMSVSASIACLLFGLIVARLIGIVLDGAILKQWINVGIEVVLMIPFVWWYFHARI